MEAESEGDFDGGFQQSGAGQPVTTRQRSTKAGPPAFRALQLKPLDPADAGVHRLAVELLAPLLNLWIPTGANRFALVAFNAWPSNLRMWVSLFATSKQQSLFSPISV
jgi:hypothetical protein